MNALHILHSSPLQRPTTVRALQPHAAEVSFITPRLVQCGSIVGSCVNRHLLHLLLARLHLEERDKLRGDARMAECGCRGLKDVTPADVPGV